MKREDILEVLSNVSFAPSNLDMGWKWDVKETKIYDDNIVIEKGFSVRTTFMRPDANSGEIEMGYGRWMYVPDNISKDGLVKTAWLCAELIIKHELMEAFLYDKNRIFDPHKSLSDLQYNARSVGKEIIVDTEKVIKTEPRMVKEDFSNVEEQEDVKLDNKIHEQNIESHRDDIREYLGKNLKKLKIPGSEFDNYQLGVYRVIHTFKDGRGVVTISNSNDKVIDYTDEKTYNESGVKNILSNYIKEENKSDPAEINRAIHSYGFTNGKQRDDIWFFKNPDIEDRFILHSEQSREFGLINGKGDVLGGLSFTEDQYNMSNLDKIFQFMKLD